MADSMTVLVAAKPATATFNGIMLGALLGVMIGPVSLLGQDSIIPLRPLGCAFDSAAASQLVTVYLSLSPSATDSRHVEAALPVAMALADHYHQPDRLAIHSWPGTFFPTRPDAGNHHTAVTYFGLSGTLLFNLDRYSHLSGQTPVITTDSPDLNLALAHAVAEAANEGSLTPATGRQAFQITESALPEPNAVNLARIQIRAIVIDQPPRFISAPLMDYPKAATKRGYEDWILVQFVIREDGTVDPVSPRVVRATYQEFAESAIRIVKGARFQPAQVRGCPVRVRVTQSVTFTAH